MTNWNLYITMECTHLVRQTFDMMQYKPLTIIVSFDSADQAEELDHPAETLLHLKHKHTGQDLEERHNKHCGSEPSVQGMFSRTFTTRFLLFTFLWYTHSQTIGACKAQHLQHSQRQQWLHAYRQHIFRYDDSHIIHDEAVPEGEASPGRLDQEFGAKQQEEEAGQQVSEAKHRDPGGASDEDHWQHQPEEVTEHKDFGHVQVTPGAGTEKKERSIFIFTDSQWKRSFVDSIDGHFVQ